MDRRTIIGMDLDTSGAEYTIHDIVSSSLEGMGIMMEAQLVEQDHNYLILIYSPQKDASWGIGTVAIKPGRIIEDGNKI